MSPKLLDRQLRAARNKDGVIDVEILVGIIAQTYEEVDRERRLNDRAAKLMEDELVAANEQARREHNAVLATILDGASDGMLVTTQSGTIDTANHAAEIFFGAPSGGLAGLSLGQLMAGKAGEAVAFPVAGTAQNLHEGSGRKLDGTAFPIEFTVNVLGSSTKPLLLWIVRDISERIRIQHDLTETRLRFQDFAEASSDCFWQIDSALAAPDVNAPANAEFAALVAHVLSPSNEGGCPEGVSPAAWSSLQNHLAERRHFRIARFDVTHVGIAANMSLSGKPIFDMEGNFCGYRGTARDTTREVAAQAAAQRAERHLAEAMETAPNAIAMVDSSLNFVAGNSALRLLGIGQSELLGPGLSFTSFVADAIRAEAGAESEARAKQILRDLIDTRNANQLNLGDRWLLAAARSLSDGGAVLTFSDVTSIKEREREFEAAKSAAESASHLKSQFLATMSHELRTPLNAILGFSEVIRDQVFGSTPEMWMKYADYASSINASGTHLLSLISEILDLSKIDAGSYVLDVETLDLRDIVANATTMIASVAQKNGVRLERIPSDVPLPVDGEARALRQVMLNLLSNAVKFTPKDGTVRIRSSLTDDVIEISVSDTGIGIAQEHIVSLFEPFRQVDASVRRRHEGTGLGLAITKRLVELHGGTIALESEINVGTTVRVRLPRAARAEAEAAA